MKKTILMKLVVAVPLFVAGFMAGVIATGQSTYIASDVSLLVTALVVGLLNLFLEVK